MRAKPIERYIIAVFALTPFVAVAQSGHSSVSERGKYVAAKPIKVEGPMYPPLEAEHRHEGWVVLSYIVTTKGNVKDVMIEDSTGNKALELAAVRTAERWRYKPATLNGKPVDQSIVHETVTFTLDNSPKSARPRFAHAFSYAQKEIRAGRLDRAQKTLDGPELTDRENFYEDAWFWWLKYEYLSAAGHSTPAQLVNCLHKAVGYQEGDLPGPKEDYNYLPPDVLVAAAARLFVLQAQTLDLSGATRTFSMLSSSAAARGTPAYLDVMKQLKPLYAKIKSLISSDRILEMNARVGEFGDWVDTLVRRSFSLGNVRGHLDSLEVRCGRKTESFAAISGSVFAIPDSWGECGVYVKGDEGTTFALYQYPKKSG